MTIAEKRRKWLVLFMISLAGCSQELPLPAVPKVIVKGKLSRGGRPLDRGWVEFVPVDGGSGVLRSGSIKPDGSFEVTSIGPGLHGIRVIVPRDRSFYPFDQFFSPIRRSITAEPNQFFDINLDNESRNVNK